MQRKLDFTFYTGFSRMVLQQGAEATAEYTRKLGFRSVEILADTTLEHMNAVKDVASAAELRRVLDMYELPMACYSIGADLWKEAEDVDRLKHHLDLAAELGSPLFHHILIPWVRTFPENPPAYEDALERVLERAIQVADYAAGLGITCIYEDQGFYFNGVKGFGGFWKQMKNYCSNTGICCDMGNILFVNETAEDFLEQYAEDVKHVHLKDYLWKQTAVSPGKYWYRTRNGSFIRDTMVGSGIVNVEAYMEKLQQVGYCGRYGLEATQPEPFEESALQAMEYVSRFVK